MKGLDTYLTSTPWDNEIDWGSEGAKCPKCGCDCFEELDQDTDKETVKLACDDCGEEFDHKYEPEEPGASEPHCKHCDDLDLTCKHC